MGDVAGQQSGESMGADGLQAIWVVGLRGRGRHIGTRARASRGVCAHASMYILASAYWPPLQAHRDSLPPQVGPSSLIEHGPTTFVSGRPHVCAGRQLPLCPGAVLPAGLHARARHCALWRRAH